MTDYTLGLLHGAVLAFAISCAFILFCVVFAKSQPNDGQHEQIRGEPE